MTLSEVFEGLWLIVREKALAFWREDNAPKRTNRGRGEESLLLVPIPAARSKWVFFIFFAALVCVGLKAFWLQCGISTDFLKKQGEARYARTLPVPAQRGQIVDRNGVVLASTIPARSVWADPQEALELKHEDFVKLAGILEI